MKHFKEWAEEFPILIPDNISLEVSRQYRSVKELEEKTAENKQRFLKRYHSFIKRIQKDAYQSGKRAKVKC